MTTPQPGIFAEGSRFHHALEYGVASDTAPEALRAAFAAVTRDIPALVAVTREAPAGMASVVAFGRALWARLAPGRMPMGFADFTAIEGWGGTACPATGGAFVLTQRWVHDLAAFNRLSVAEQERVIGRTKPDSIELEGDAMPADSHVSRTDVSLDGVALTIYRRSFPYGAAAEHGLTFLAFARDPDRFAVQLARMFGTSGDALHDRLTEFSRPATGAYWYAPSVEGVEAVVG